MLAHSFPVGQILCSIHHRNQCANLKSIERHVRIDAGRVAVGQLGRHCGRIDRGSPQLPVVEVQGCEGVWQDLMSNFHGTKQRTKASQTDNNASKTDSKMQAKSKGRQDDKSYAGI